MGLLTVQPGLTYTIKSPQRPNGGFHCQCFPIRSLRAESERRSAGGEMALKDQREVDQTKKGAVLKLMLTLWDGSHYAVGHVTHRVEIKVQCKHSVDNREVSGALKCCLEVRGSAWSGGGGG